MSIAHVPDVIIGSVLTEKSTTALDKFTKLTLIVRKDATKSQIAAAVQAVYMASNIISINTMIYKGKITRFRGRYGKSSSYKKAVISFKDDLSSSELSKLSAANVSAANEAEKILE